MTIFQNVVDNAERCAYIVRCDCGGSDHDIELSWYRGDDEIYFHYHLPKQTFWKRVTSAIKHIFGYRSKYGDFGEVVLFKKDVEKLSSIFEECKKEIK